MKKLIIILLTLFVTGCTVVRIDTANIDNMVNVILSKDNTLYNRVGKGYKYYVPRGVSYIDTNEFNDKLYSDGNYYYLYIDAVSYFQKLEVTYPLDDDFYYYREIDLNGKKGYITIKQQNDKYFITFVYNYAKIESLVNKEDINTVVMNASYILSTIKFNNNVINLMLKKDYFTNKEEKYDLFEETDDNTNDNLIEYDEEG